MDQLTAETIGHSGLSGLRVAAFVVAVKK